MCKLKCCLFIAVVIVIFSASFSLSAETVSIRFSYNSNSIATSDLDTWISSTSSLWQDWHQLNGGEISGEFPLISYGPSMEVELRFNIFAGLGLNIGGSSFSSSAEGTLSLQSGSGQQVESQFIKNKVSAIPIKIGISYSYSFPALRNLSLNAGFGRHLTFIKYTVTDNQEATFQRLGGLYTYRRESNGSYRSEALGLYATFAVEFELVRFLALFAEAEKIWSKADGFKGTLNSTYFEDLNGVVATTSRSDKASLYYYESDPLELGTQYSILRGSKDRPDDPGFQNVRQGELNLNNTVFKIGIRLKF